MNPLPSFPPATPTPLRSPSDKPPKRELKGILGTLFVIGVLILKFGAKLKFLLIPLAKFFPLILKTGGTMLITIGIYTSFWGWKYAVGFVLLILVHECGHLVAAKKFGLKVGAPVFIPFMGAFIALKEAPRNAWIEASVGIGGPLLGSAGALLCHAAGERFEVPLLIALAWTGYWLNLFNLTPIGSLDGGRIATALSPWLWIPGLAIMGYMAFTRSNFIIWLILFLSIPRIISLFRKKTDEQKRYFEVTPNQRLQMAAMYFGLIGALVFMMETSNRQLDNIHRQPAPQVATPKPSLISHPSSSSRAVPSESGIEQNLLIATGICWLRTHRIIGQTFEPADRIFAPVGKYFGPVAKTFGPIAQSFGPVGQNFAPVGEKFGPAGTKTDPELTHFAPVAKNFAPADTIRAPAHRSPAPAHPIFPPANRIPTSADRIPVARVSIPSPCALIAPPRASIPRLDDSMHKAAVPKGRRRACVS